MLVDFFVCPNHPKCVQHEMRQKTAKTGIIEKREMDRVK